MQVSQSTYRVECYRLTCMYMYMLNTYRNGSAVLYTCTCSRLDVGGKTDHTIMYMYLLLLVLKHADLQPGKKKL